MKKAGLLFAGVLCALFFSACVMGTSSNLDDTGGGNSGSSGSSGGGSNGTPAGVSGGSGTTESSNKAANLDFIFNNQTLGTTTVTITRSEWDVLCDNYRFFYKNENYVHAQSYEYSKDGKTWTLNNVGFKLRGNTSRFCPQGVDNGRKQNQPNAQWAGSYYDYAEQPNSDYRQSHFKVGFEEFCADDEENKLAGCMKGVALKRMDHSCGREIFCYDLFRKNGIWTAPRACHTRLIIKIIENNSVTTTVDYGVYEMFEEVNKMSLKARAQDENSASNAWKNSKGYLWKCSSDLTDSSGNGMGVENICINFDSAGNRVNYTWDSYPMDLKNHKDEFETAKAQFCSFIAELNALPNPSGDSDTASISTIKAFYEKWFDVDFFLKTYAVNILCGMDDDYWGNANNYYLYFDTGSAKSTNKAYFIPFDYDNTLGCSISDGGFLHNPFEWGRGKDRPLLDKLLKVPEYKTKFGDCLLEVSSNSYWNFDTCSALFLKWKGMVEPYLNSPDLNFTGLGVSSFGDYTWQPSGYYLTSSYNNIYTATKASFIKWVTGKDYDDGVSLKISEKKDSSYNGIKISIERIPLDAAVRKVYINGKLVANAGFDSETGVISAPVTASEFGYPYTKAGNEYKIYVSFENTSYANIATSNTITITAERGKGEFCVTNTPKYEIINNVLTFNPEPVLQIGSASPRSDDNWDEYYVLELTTTSWDYQSWNHLGASCNNFDFKGENVVKPGYESANLMFCLYYVVKNDDYGAYRLVLYDNDDTKSFTLK